MLINVLCNLPEQLEAVLEAARGTSDAAERAAYHGVGRDADHGVKPARTGIQQTDEIQAGSGAASQVETGEGLKTGQERACRKIYGEIMIESAKFPESEFEDIVMRCHEARCGCRLALPYIFRDKAESWFEKNKQIIADAHFDGYLVRSLSEFSVVREILEAQRGAGTTQKMSEPPGVCDTADACVQAKSEAGDETAVQSASPSQNRSDVQSWTDTALIKTDYNMYAMNRDAKQMLTELGADMLTAPVELNERELHALDISGMEILVFGRIPMMISAQCLKNAAFGCENRKNVQIKDRTGKVMPVENVCRLCYNLVYNAVPLSMIGVKDRVLKLSPHAVRLSFTTEDGASCRNILKAYTDAFGGEGHAADQGKRRSRRSAAERNEGRGGNGGSGRTVEEPVPEYTRGHFSRGVE